MKNNMSKIILEDVQEVNKDTRTLINEAFHGARKLKEENIVEQDVPYDNTSEKFCPRCGRTYTEYPALSRYDNETYICPDCGVEEAMINYTGGTLTDPNRVKQESADTSKKDDMLIMYNPKLDKELILKKKNGKWIGNDGEVYGEDISIDDMRSEFTGSWQRVMNTDKLKENEAANTSKKDDTLNTHNQKLDKVEFVDKILDSMSANEIAKAIGMNYETDFGDIDRLTSWLLGLNYDELEVYFGNVLHEGKKIPIHNEISDEEIIQMFRQMVKDNPNNEKAKDFLKKYDPDYKEDKKDEDCDKECKEDLKEDEIETPTQEDLDNDDKAKKEAERKEIEDRIGELKVALDGGELSEDDVKDVQKQISELEAQLSALDECDKTINESEEDSFKYSYDVNEIREKLEASFGVTSAYSAKNADDTEFQEGLDESLKNIDHIESTTQLTMISQQGADDFPGFKGGSVKTFLTDGRVFLWSAGDEDDLSLINAVELVLSKEIKED